MANAQLETDNLAAPWIETAKLASVAIAAGKPANPYIDAFIKRATAAGYDGRGAALTLAALYPCDQSTRLDFLQRSFQDFYPANIGDWRTRSLKWATPQEVAHCEKHSKLYFDQQVAQMVAANAAAQPKRAPEVTAIQPAATIIQPERMTEEIFLSPEPVAGTGLEAMATAIATAYEAQGIAVTVDWEQTTSKAPRCNRIVVIKTPQTTFATLEKWGDEVLSNAGIDPSLAVPAFRRRANNRLEIQIPRDPSTWQTPELLSCVSNPAELERLRSSKDFGQWSKSLRAKWKVSMQERLRVPFAIDLEGQPFSLDLSSHCLFGGGSGGGKSSALHLALCGLLIMYPPQWLQLALFDFQEGISLKKYEGLAAIFGDGVATDTESAEKLFDQLNQEYLTRLSNMAASGHEDILEYNTANTANPMGWVVIVLEEVSAFRSEAGDRANQLIEDALSRWRKTGMVILGAIQYSTREEGFAPKARQNFGSKVCFRSDQNAAEFILGGSSTWTRLAPSLVPPGDCIILQSGQFHRCQTLFFAPGHRLSFIKAVKKAYHCVRSLPSAESDNPFGDIVELEPPPKVEPQQPRRLAVVSGGISVREAMASLREQGGLESITQTSLIRQLWGVKGGRQLSAKQTSLQTLLQREFGTDDLETAKEHL